MSVQIKRACKMCNAVWAVWVRRSGSAWVFGPHFGLTAARRAVLNQSLEEPDLRKRMMRVIASGRAGSYPVGTESGVLKAQKVFAFANPAAEEMLLVGADKLTPQVQSFFRILALTPAFQSPGDDITNFNARRLSPDALAAKPSAAAGMQDPRLEQERLASLASLQLIQQAVHKAAGLTGTTFIAQVSAEYLAGFFRCEAVALLLVDETSTALVCSGFAGAAAGRPARIKHFPVDRGLIGRVYQSGEGMILNDFRQDPDYRSPAGWTDGSVICVPLRDDERVLGVMNLEHTQKDAFTSNDLSAAISLALIFSGMMIQARQYEELEVKVRHLQAARETALDISRKLESETVFRRVVHRALKLANARGAALALMDENTSTMHIVCTENPWWGDLDKPIPLEASMIAHILSTRESYTVENYPVWDKEFAGNRSLPFLSMAAVPLKLKNEIMGILFVLDDQPGRVFRQDEVDLLEMLAPQVTVSIYNARLYKELEEYIEAQRRMEKQLIRSTRLATVGEMAAGVAHELNNPLTTISGFVELALNELPVDYSGREELRIVFAEAGRAQAVVRRLLDFARQSDNVCTWTDLNVLLRETLLLVQHTADASGVVVEQRLDPTLPFLYIDSNQIKQVILNLLYNALQAMPRGGALVIETLSQRRLENMGVVLSIMDTGHGITPAVQERIFDPFFTTRDVGEGTGLGLSVSYGIVTKHGGTIEVESKTGLGTCFTIWLPVRGVEQND